MSYLNIIKNSEFIEKMGKPTVQNRVCAAIFIAVHGADYAGIRTKLTLMWPLERFTNQEVEKEASSLLECVYKNLLNLLPPQNLEKIEKGLDERLSFAVRPQ